MSSLFPINLSADVTPAIQAISDIAKNTSYGIAKILYALFGPWVEERHGKAKMIAAQADYYAKEITDGSQEYFDNKLPKSLATPKISNLEEACKVMCDLEQDCKSKRLLTAIIQTAKILNEFTEEEIAKAPLNQTFFNHWREEAELIDDEELRVWWSRLLVEEVKKPNSISPRTLEVVKNLSKQEALIFEKVIQFCFGDTIIVNSKDIPLGGEYSDILSLQDAGIIGQISNRWFDGSELHGLLDKHTILPVPGQNYIFTASAKRITYRCHILTIAGKQLLSTLHRQTTLDNLKIIAREISRQNSSALINLYSCIPGQPLSLNTPLWTSVEKEGEI